MTTLTRNEISEIIRHMSNPRNIRELSWALMKLGANSRIKENAAKRVVGIRVSELYRQRKQAMLDWARKFNKAELQRLANLPNEGPYERRIQSIPVNAQTRQKLIKAIIARYLLNQNAQHWENARNAVQRIHRAAGHEGNDRIPNARLVNFMMGLPIEQLRQFNANLPFYA